MHAPFPRHRNAGIGLIEALLALLVISLGVVGVARLQSSTFGLTASSKARNVAQDLARAKLDDLRNYQQLESGGAGIYGYDEIAGNSGNNRGGSETADGTLRLPSGDVTVGNTTYNRSWRATGYYVCGTTTGTTNCTPAKTRPDFYGVLVTITWTDKDGAQTLRFDGTVAARDPRTSPLSMISGSSQMRPIVDYRPQAAPQVIAIGLGSGQKRETSAPIRTIVGDGNRDYSRVAFSAVRYNAGNDTLEREDFVTVQCRCRQRGALAGAENLKGESVTKRQGERLRGPELECTVCCRDHHDDSTCTNTSAGKKNCYSPHREESEYLTISGTRTDHKHYDENGNPADNVNDVYVESCRLKNVDGRFRVVQDWRLVHLSAVPKSYFEGTTAATNVSNYETYVKDVVTAKIRGTSDPAKTWTTTETVTRGATKEVLARGIYLDYLDDTETSALATALANNEAGVFLRIPFYELNLTTLANWSSSNTAVATVNGSGVVSGVGVGTATVTAKARRGNNGVLGLTAASDTTNTLSDSVSAVVVAP